MVSIPEARLAECVLICKNSFVFGLTAPSKTKTGLIAFHLAYVQVLSVPSMEAVVFQHLPLDVLQTLTSVSYQDVVGAKNAAGT